MNKKEQHLNKWPLEKVLTSSYHLDLATLRASSCRFSLKSAGENQMGQLMEVCYDVKLENFNSLCSILAQLLDIFCTGSEQDKNSTPRNLTTIYFNVLRRELIHILGGLIC
jgi:hypothetical protein